MRLNSLVSIANATGSPLSCSPPPSWHSFVRFLLLVLEQSRVEVAVLLNDLAYLKYEASNNCSSTAETILLKQRNVAIAFSLMEKIIKVISDAGGNEGT